MRWKFHEGAKVNGRQVQADLSGSGDYVISHRPGDFNASYRPTGQHHHVGSWPTLVLAKKGCEEYERKRTKAEVPATRDPVQILMERLAKRARRGLESRDSDLGLSRSVGRGLSAKDRMDLAAHAKESGITIRRSAMGRVQDESEKRSEAWYDAQVAQLHRTGALDMVFPGKGPCIIFERVPSLLSDTNIRAYGVKKNDKVVKKAVLMTEVELRQWLRNIQG